MVFEPEFKIRPEVRAEIEQIPHANQTVRINPGQRQLTNVYSDEVANIWRRQTSQSRLAFSPRTITSTS